MKLSMFIASECIIQLYPEYNKLKYFKNLYLPMNSETGSLSPSHLIVPVISSFSTIGKNKSTNSNE